MELNITGKPIIDGEAEGTLLRLAAPISFWGGVDRDAASITDPKHPDYGTSLSDKVVAIPMIIGSSSSSQVLLNLMYKGIAPKAILLGEVDAIILMAALVGEEMGFGEITIVQCELEELQTGAHVTICRGGSIRQIS